MSKHLSEIITNLGYSESPNLIYKYDDSFYTCGLSAHTIKVLNLLSPYAVYIVDDNPFVLFFDEPGNQEEQKELCKKIWNAQIPIVIFCGTATIKIYCGYSINKETHLLPAVDELSFSTINVIDDNSPFSYWEITNQNFWKKYEKQFSGKKLNGELLNNLAFLTEKLTDTYNIPFATKLVLRMIFIRYLIDRGVNLDYPGFSYNVEESKRALLALLSNQADLYALFAHLKDRFNGNLFETDEDAIDSLTESALVELRDFLSANIVTRSGQFSLFDIYDFNIIPVELISNIYEILLGKEDRNKDKAFYTPKYLADYILDMTVQKHIEENETCKVLDPACGSGVFLVDSYRRMIEKKLNGALYTEDNTLLCDTLKDNIYGIDLNPDSIDVAIFSLYLAILDYKNPKTLNQFMLPDIKGSNLIKCDFFDEDGLKNLQESVAFDFIIGNPPWGNYKGLHMDYCRKYEYLQYTQNNLCRAYFMRSKDFTKLNRNTKCCFVLHSKILYTQSGSSVKFRNYLLTNTKIENVVELSTVRKLVFNGAVAPAIIISYEFTEENPSENRFEYISMKRNEFFRLFSIIVVEKTDIKSVSQRLLIDNDWAWKTLVYGLTGDLDNIFKLRSTYQTIQQGIKSQSPKIMQSTGVQYNDGDMKDASHLLGRPLLDSKTAIDHFKLYENNSYPFTKERINRPRNKALFSAPYCLVMSGLNTMDYTMKAVYSEIDFVFHKAVYAIKGTIEQKLFLLNTVGLLNSKLFAYFNLMLGSSAGIEREMQITNEVLSFPFVYSDDIALQVEHIQDIKKQADNWFVNPEAYDEIDTLNQMIFDAFGLSDNEFVDYALRIQIPQLTGANDSDVYRRVLAKDFEKYSEYFYNFLSEVFANAGKHIKIIIYPEAAKHYSAVEVLVLDENPGDWLSIAGSDNQIAMLAKLSSHKINEQFYSLKDVLFFEENSFYIIKPNYYKNWHPAIAKIDLMEVTGQILSGNDGGDRL